MRLWDNQYPEKQPQKMIFSRIINKTVHPVLYFNQKLVKSLSTHKHFGIALETKLNVKQAPEKRPKQGK